MDLKIFKKKIGKGYINKTKSFYIKNGEIIFENDFTMLEEYMEKVYTDCYKKIFSTQDSKTFDLKFSSNSETKDTLLNITKNFTKENIMKIIDKVIEGLNHDEDFILNCSYINIDGEDYFFCTVNNVEIPKKMILISAEKQKIEESTDCNIVMSKSPVAGFCYPSPENGTENIVMYNAKNKDLNKRRIEEAFDVKFTFTAEEEKEIFIELLEAATEEKDIDIETNKKIYDDIESRIDEEDIFNSLVNVDEIRTILVNNGVDIDEEQYYDLTKKIGIKTFKIVNIVPFKGIKIETKEATINLSKEAIGDIHKEKNKLILNIKDEDFKINW